jgi:two-component system response regulator FlrC
MKFEQAQQGTILLDEITEMELSLQAKLLRVLQEREVERLGGRKTISLNVRVIATSNRDIKEAVANGTFREDLYYRLNVFPITWLSLSQRVGDIIPLAKHLLTRHFVNIKGKLAAKVPEFTASAVHKLTTHTWPGNVRELENVIQRALILTNGLVIDSNDLLIEPDNQQIFDSNSSFSAQVNPIQDDKSLLGSELRLQEHQIILDALQAYNGKRKDVAEKLGISPRTLRYKLAKMRESGIDLPS